MTSRPAPEPRHRVAEPSGDIVRVTTEWCPVCKAFTRLTGHTVLLTPAGVTRVGRWSWCETCDMEEAPSRV
ncbi:hypothetical protein [Streptomyces sp. AD55]|uniref:hypothetical protein n=1 Tax=Streptomyces sp. AD55 TaxID=3242895 RepID=UPI0035281674